MAGNITPLDQLKSFLNEIFQFETQDLDFGIYKIMHYKRKEIRNFIDKLLVEKVTEQLKTISDDETKSIGLQLKQLEKDDVIKGWLAAADSDKATLEKLYPDKFRVYHDLTVKADEPNFFMLAEKSPEMAVDLVETFNYLIGLHMQKCITKEINGRMYQFICGNNNANKQILVIWRNVKGWTPD